MKGTLTTIKVDGSKTTKTYVGRGIPLEDLNKAVGGYIELVPLFNRYQGERCVVFCNEEGKLEGLPINPCATIAWFHCLVPGHKITDHLVGDIAIVTGDEEFMELL